MQDSELPDSVPAGASLDGCGRAAVDAVLALVVAFVRSRDQVDELLAADAVGMSLVMRLDGSGSLGFHLVENGGANLRPLFQFDVDPQRNVHGLH